MVDMPLKTVSLRCFSYEFYGHYENEFKDWSKFMAKVTAKHLLKAVNVCTIADGIAPYD